LLRTKDGEMILMREKLVSLTVMAMAVIMLWGGIYALSEAGSQSGFTSLSAADMDPDLAAHMKNVAGSNG
jgi:hypothetical protein